MPGKRGAPLGNNNRAKGAARGRLITEQIVKALKQYEKKDDDPKIAIKRGQAVRKIADQIVEKAVNGEQWAIEWLADRVEGKATQRVESTGQVNHNITAIPIEFVERPAIDVTPKLPDGTD